MLINLGVELCHASINLVQVISHPPANLLKVFPSRTKTQIINTRNYDERNNWISLMFSTSLGDNLKMFSFLVLNFCLLGDNRKRFNLMISFAFISGLMALMIIHLTPQHFTSFSCTRTPKLMMMSLFHYMDLLLLDLLRVT